MTNEQQKRERETSTRPLRRWSLTSCVVALLHVLTPDARAASAAPDVESVTIVDATPQTAEELGVVYWEIVDDGPGEFVQGLGPNGEVLAEAYIDESGDTYYEAASEGAGDVGEAFVRDSTSARALRIHWPNATLLPNQTLPGQPIPMCEKSKCVPAPMICMQGEWQLHDPENLSAGGGYKKECHTTCAPIYWWEPC